MYMSDATPALFPAMRAARLPPGKPLLLVVVDTEEEFDWGAPFDRAATAVTAVPGQALAQDIFRPHGLRPTYVIDYPIASTASSVEYFRALLDRNECQIGTHLHPWVTPPHDEIVSDRNSYPGNLPSALEHAKLSVMTETITRNFGVRPTMYKAGRYGLGPATATSLASLGYRIDLSALVHTDLRPIHGPDYRGTPDRPFWFGDDLFEVPMTRGFFGALAGVGARLYPRTRSAIGQRARLPGILSRARLLERATLTPEGTDLAAAQRLVWAMRKQGHRVFSLTYHSPSLAIGHTPYVRTEQDLERFLAMIRQFTDWFFGAFGGSPTTPEEVRALAETAVPALD